MEWYLLINSARHALASSDADTPIGHCFNVMTHVFPASIPVVGGMVGVVSRVLTRHNE
ncbi:hypothetical protein ACO0K0_17470 [Undibacterium sp. SXout11W]|uniref:hypothetical protein n=1 Tax=Undibacterium sp. SXout11W TaxID=3413050 RepID=UPI003BF04E74